MMVRHFLTTILLVIPVLLYCQKKIVILDSVESKTIPYAEVISNGDSFFSDSLGTIQIMKDSQLPLIIKKQGFLDKKIDRYTSVIYLTPVVKKIQEIIVNRKTDVKFESKILKSNTSGFPKDLSIGIILKGKKNMTGKLKEISIPIRRIYDKEALIKIDFYDVKENKISNESINTESIIISVKELSKKINKINLEEYNITFNEETLMSLRIINETGKTQKEIGESSIQFYNSKEKGDLYFYNYYFNQWKILSLNMNLPSVGYTVSY